MAEIIGATTRDGLLSRFCATYRGHYGSPDIAPSIVTLLAQLVDCVPSEAFVDVDPAKYGYVQLVGAFPENDSEDEDGRSDDSGIARQCVNDLLQTHRLLPPNLPITLEISSPGGEVYLGLLIQSTISQLRREGRRVVGYVKGWAFSAAFDVLQLCDWRIAEPNAALMVHEDQYAAEGNSSAALDDAIFSKKMERRQFEILAARTGRPVQYYVEKVAHREWYLTPEEARDEGLLDEIAVIPPFPIAATKPLAAPRAARRKKKAPPPELTT
ncbi:MAG: ATP-dependent Clp protease proteolytic subunit [Candidatus Dormibacteria bacterium]